MATRHNNEVLSEIARLKREGFTEIKASVPGFELPHPIGKEGRVADVVATKRGKQVIVEVEEKGQVRSQKEQISTFRRSAAHKRNTRFILRTYRKGKSGSKRLS